MGLDQHPLPEHTMIELVLDPTGFWKPFLAVLLSFLVAQGAKMLLDIRAGRRASVFENGGMPSSHTAIIVALFMTVLIEQGLSLLLIVIFFIGLLFIDDAVGVRRETSRHSTFLNELIKKKKFRIVGHEPMEVFVGAVIGFVVPFLLYAFV